MLITQLPDLILFNIFSHLSNSSANLCAITQVCKQWHKESKNPTIWRALLFSLPRGKMGESLYGKGVTGPDYKKMYITMSMGLKWNTGVCPVTLHGHTAPVVCLDYNGKHAISGSAEGQMRVWDIAKGNCMKTFQQHSAAVRAIQFDSVKIISASEDQTLRLWRLGQGTVDILQQFKFSLRSARFAAETVVCGGVNPVVSVIDIPTCKVKSQLKGHGSIVYSLDLNGQLVVSGSGDDAVKVWDLRTDSCVHTFAHHSGKVRGVNLAAHLLASGSEDKTIKIVDIRKMTVIDKHELNSPINAMHFDGLRCSVATTTGIGMLVDGQAPKRISLSNATCARFSPLSPTLVAGFMDYHISVMDFVPRGTKRKVT